MEAIERGARVYISNADDVYYFGKTGTVRNLHGDPPDTEYPDPFSSMFGEKSVFVKLDDGTPTAWIEIADLARL